MKLVTTTVVIQAEKSRGATCSVGIAGMLQESMRHVFENCSNGNPRIEYNRNLRTEQNRNRARRQRKVLKRIEAACFCSYNPTGIFSELWLTGC